MNLVKLDVASEQESRQANEEGLAVGLGESEKRVKPSPN